MDNEPISDPRSELQVKTLLMDAVNCYYRDADDLAPKVKREYEENKFSVTFVNGRKFTVQVIEEHDG